MDWEKIYGGLPPWLQNMAASMEGWRIQRNRFGGSFQNLLTAAESRTFWSAEQLQSYQNRRLKEFVRHCAETVPYYQRVFRELGLSPDDVRSLQDLKHLPILTKKDVQDHYSDLISSAISAEDHMICHTSGTTGGGLHLTASSQSIQEQWAVWWRYWRWHGIQQGTWCGYFGGRSVVPLSQTHPPFWRYNYPGRQILFSAYHMSPNNLNSYISELRRRKTTWIHGYPSLLALLAEHILERGMDLGYEVRWVTIGAENLLRQQQAIIQRAFGVSPIQHYGMAEAVANASECEYGSLHLDEDFAAVELVPNSHGEGYRVIGTNFTNPVTPLLRYDVEDIITVSDEKCRCGRSGRILASIDGRAEDYVILKNGAKLGRMDHIFKDLVSIREAQIHQTQPGQMLIRVVRGSAYNEDDEAMLLRETRKRVGDLADVSIEYPDCLDRSEIGKLRFVVSEIPEGQLEHFSHMTLANH